MCRLFGQISISPRTAEDFLTGGYRSLLRQSHYRPGDFQKDGWGIGYFENSGRARVVKSPNPAYEDHKKFAALAEKIRSKVVIGHLRAATNPMGIDPKKIICMENTHPFTDGRFIFAHNGSIEIPAEVRQHLGDYRRHLIGANDSEIYFWQFRKFYDQTRDVPRALQACIQEIWALWKNTKKRYPKKKAPYTSLNALISDGTSLHALCHYLEPADLRSFFNPKQNWRTMSFSQPKGRVIFSSEDMGEGPWEHFRKSEIISAVPSAEGLATIRKHFQI